MSLEILTFTLGPLENNTYLIVNSLTHTAVLVDPSYGSEQIIPILEDRGWSLSAAWITHAHFDHIGGLQEILTAVKPPVSVALHPLDLLIWQEGGGARMFGFPFTPLPEPDLFLEHAQKLAIGDAIIEVRLTPGHSPGHVVFHIPSVKAVLCGDLIFYHGIGRTDLPGGSFAQLSKSIREEIYTLPPETRLLSGHGPESTVGEEMAHNPFVRP